MSPRTGTAVWDGQSAVHLASIRGTRRDCPPARVMGSRAAGHATALGKVLLAACDDTTVDTLIDRWGLPQLTAHTVVEPDKLREDLDRIRAYGVGVSVEESAVGLVCIATAIRDNESGVLAALSISGPVARFATMRDRSVAPCRSGPSGR